MSTRLTVSDADDALSSIFLAFAVFRLRQDEMQNAILQPRLDPVAVDVFGKREDALVIPVGEFVVNTLIPGMLGGRASSTDRQHPSFEGDVHTIGSHAGHFREHDDAVFRFVNVARRDEYRATGYAVAILRALPDNAARPVLCGGCSVMGIPTAIAPSVDQDQ